MNEHSDSDNHDLGLQADLATIEARRGLIGRRRALGILAGVGSLMLLAACGKDKTTSSAASGDGAPATTTPVTAGEVIPQETAGPYPGDGSNGPNALTQGGIVRSDITSSFGSSTTRATGAPLAIELTVLDSSTGKPYSGAAVYLWHCDAQGRYSLYSQGVSNENYLRGVQAADANGKLTFRSIFPGAYSGRWPHIHFEVYPSVAKATSVGNKITTSQLALPEDVCEQVYGADSSTYATSSRNLASSSLSRDIVFRDGVDQQMATVTGDAQSGYVAKLTFTV